MKQKLKKLLGEKDQSLLAPSLLSARFECLGLEVRKCEKAGADLIHIDVMDGHFVPNLTIGPLVVSAIRPHTSLPLDCHLMVSRPEDWIQPFAEAGADLITVHAEATAHPKSLLERIRSMGVAAGISINPGTPVSSIEPLLDAVDLVLLMSVNPGFGGQKFMESVLPKVKHLARLRDPHDRSNQSARGQHDRTRSFAIEVDGGLNPSNARAVREAGCDIFVAGHALFSKPDFHKAVMDFRKVLQP